MGREAQCAAEFDAFQGEGKVQLETDELIFRGAQRLVVPRADITSAIAQDGWLEIAHAGGRARFRVGASANRWAHDILHPKSLIDKLDVKLDMHVAVLGIEEGTFLEPLRARAARVDTRLGRGPYHLIFMVADTPRALERLPTLRSRLDSAGGVWLVTPRGVPALGHDPIVAAARTAGLVDVKAARFSDTHTALKLVIPLRDR